MLKMTLNQNEPLPIELAGKIQFPKYMSKFHPAFGPNENPFFPRPTPN